MKPKLVGVKTFKLVILALHDIERSTLNRKGATAQDVTKHISEKYKVDYTKTKGDILATLSRGVTFGIFTEEKGRYKLEEVPEPLLCFPGSEPEKKPKKLGTLLVEKSKSSIKRKKKPNKKSTLDLDMMIKPLCNRTVENPSTNDHEMAKRRRLLAEELNEFGDDDDDFSLHRTSFF